MADLPLVPPLESVNKLDQDQKKEIFDFCKKHRALVQSNTRSMTCKWKALTLPQQAYKTQKDSNEASDTEASDTENNQVEENPEYESDSSGEEEDSPDQDTNLATNVGFVTRAGRQVWLPQDLLE